MNDTKIEWCDMTWNPVTGCRHGCEYCYARRMTARFSGRWDEERLRTVGGDGGIHVLDKPLFRHATGNNRDIGVQSVAAPFPYGFDPTFHRYRLDQPKKRKETQTVFVCSMADLFGRWVPDEWIADVFAACDRAPQHRYLFLTKNPERYAELEEAADLPSDENFWYGTTVTNVGQIERAAKAFGNLPVTARAFLSIEPLIEDITGSHGWAVSMENASLEPYFNWLIIGAMTGPGSSQKQPKRDWIEEIVKAADGASIPVFMKDSLIPIIGEENMRREMPWMQRMAQADG